MCSLPSLSLRVYVCVTVCVGMCSLPSLSLRVCVCVCVGMCSLPSLSLRVCVCVCVGMCSLPSLSLRVCVFVDPTQIIYRHKYTDIFGCACELILWCDLAPLFWSKLETDATPIFYETHLYLREAVIATQDGGNFCILGISKHVSFSVICGLRGWQPHLKDNLEELWMDPTKL